MWFYNCLPLTSKPTLGHGIHPELHFCIFCHHFYFTRRTFISFIASTFCHPLITIHTNNINWHNHVSTIKIFFLQIIYPRIPLISISVDWGLHMKWALQRETSVSADCTLAFHERGKNFIVRKTVNQSVMCIVNKLKRSCTKQSTRFK